MSRDGFHGGFGGHGDGGHNFVTGVGGEDVDPGDVWVTSKQRHISEELRQG
jgi:hypothetical protein